MSPIVVGQEFGVSHPRGSGKWWMPETLYLHSILHDPFILARTGSVPTVMLPSQTLKPTNQTLLIQSQPAVSSLEADCIGAVLDAGGAVVLNRPGEALLKSSSVLKWAKATQPPIESLRERWNLNSPRSYTYADQQSYDCYDPKNGHVLSWIGDHPDLIVRDQTALFAGNPWPTILGYLNTPIFGRLLLDMADLLIRVTAHFTRRELNSTESQQMAQHSELRRDFHAFGFAAFTVEQLQLCMDVSRIDLHEAQAAAVHAAEKLVSGSVAESQSLLSAAFQSLERENRKLQPEPAVFTDTLHGGGLFNDIGFCEFDWPQHAADVLSNHLDLVEQRGYRLNIDFAAKSLMHMAERFPRLFARMRTAQDAGRVEMVNGTWNQPYPPFFSLESVIRQFDLGNETIQQIFGRRANTFASQEFSFTPQTASILAQHGFRHVVLRVQNMGDAPTRAEDLVNWTAPNGDQILTLPSHAYKSEQLNEVTYNNLHLKIFAALQSSPGPHVFTGLGDITYYRPFREELARTAHYASVFGRFWTWNEYFDSARPTAPPAKLQTTMEDFDCRAAFLEVGRWDHLRSTGGGSIDHCMRSSSASELFRAAELLEVLTNGIAKTDALPHEDHWRSLATFQGHDRYFSPDWPSGGFMGGAANPTKQVGRTVSTVADYCGPTDTMTIGKRAGRELLAAEKSTHRWIRDRLQAFPKSDAERPAWVLFNPGPATQRLVRLQKLAGQSLRIGDQQIPSQSHKEDLIALVSLPAYSCSFAVAASDDSRSPCVPKNPVQCGENYIDNGLLRVEFDLECGTISKMLRSSDGQLLLVDSHRFCAPGSGAQYCEKFHWRLRGPLAASVDLKLSVPMRGGARCRIRSRITLQADQSWLEMRHHVDACPPFHGDQWEEHLGLQFVLPDEPCTLHRSHYNVLEEAHSTRIFSDNLLLADFGGKRIAWANRGNQFYVRNGRSITAMLICENEPARAFTHRVGWPRENPLSEARAWLAPVFVNRLSKTSSSPTNLTTPVQAIELDSNDLELLSLTRQNGCLRIRLANLTGKQTSTKIKSPAGIYRAWATDLTGKHRQQLEVSDGRATIALRPWDIAQVELTLAEGGAP